MFWDLVVLRLHLALESQPERGTYVQDFLGTAYRPQPFRWPHPMFRVPGQLPLHLPTLNALSVQLLVRNCTTTVDGLQGTDLGRVVAAALPTSERWSEADCEKAVADYRPLVHPPYPTLPPATAAPLPGAASSGALAVEAVLDEAACAAAQADALAQALAQADALDEVGVDHRRRMAAFLTRASLMQPDRALVADLLEEFVHMQRRHWVNQGRGDFCHDWFSRYLQRLVYHADYPLRPGLPAAAVLRAVAEEDENEARFLGACHSILPPEVRVAFFLILFGELTVPQVFRLYGGLGWARVGRGETPHSATGRFVDRLARSWREVLCWMAERQYPPPDHN